ncbi:MAG: hypothetical protein AAFX50_20350, partial [Acidobacteriota bacterium]
MAIEPAARERISENETDQPTARSVDGRIAVAGRTGSAPWAHRLGALGAPDRRLGRIGSAPLAHRIGALGASDRRLWRIGSSDQGTSASARPR